MTGVLKSLTVSQSGATAEDVSAESCHIVLDTSPPDYVEKISRYLETSVGHDKVSAGSAEADSSDSGESLFLTQAAVPEAVRSKRRHLYSSSRSKPVSPRYIEEGVYESEEDSSSSDSHGESKIDQEKRRKTYTLPKYHFPFLADGKSKPRRTLLSAQNSSLHNHVMGGFFKCVRELGQGHRRGDMMPSLPTVDKDEENLSPLSEEDTERSEDEDIKVVERKCFLVPSKAKGKPTWCNQGTQQKTRRASESKQETSRGRQTTMLNKRSVQESKLKDKPVSSRNDGHATCERNVLASTETQKTKRCLDDNIVRQEEGNTPGKQKKKKRKSKTSEAEDVQEEVDGNLESSVRVEDSADSFNMEECGKEKKKKKKRKTSGGDVEQLQSDDAEIRKKKRKKRQKEEEIAISGDCEEDKVANKTLDLTAEQLEESGSCLENAAASQETLESSHGKRKKHKKKRQPSSVAQEGENGVKFCMDDSVTVADGSGTSLKKKTVFEGVDMSYTHEESEKVENLENTQKTKDFEDQNPELVAKKKKKKKKKISEIFTTNLGKDTQNDDSVSVREKEKKRTSSFLVADAEEKDAETHEEQNPPLQCGGAEKHGVSAGDLKELKDGVTKKKKKRKMSVSQDNMENSCKQDLEEPNKTTEKGRKKKKERYRK